MHLRIGAGTDRGRVRALNEDAYVLRADEGLFLVCDGMGGAPAGDVASRMAVDAIERQLHATEAVTDVAADRSYLPHTSRLAAAVRWSNAFIYDQAQKDPRQAGMGTTVVGAWIRQHVASVAHVGDSRAYLWRSDRLEPLTRDHSLLEEQIASGLVDRNADTHEYQNVLVRVLGREPEVDVDVSEVPLQPGDYVLLCSDGLTRMVPDSELAKAIAQLRKPQRICDHLIATANGNGGSDNITVVVVEVAERWWRRLWDHWRAARRGHDVEAYFAV